ncbi:DNA alkylation repair protein [Pseudoflavonifractor sp.]|jgi:3-methyladenine DNA glycosylase AlkD|uniref:DNA alkylation repair protein n=1 Tax=Pseudoflavonifractor sp. TaxID=1980281 RepID=UPI003D94799E
MDMDAIQEKLFALQDLNYRQFQAKLMPTVDPEQIIGVRMPALRKLAKELKGTAEAESFLDALPHRYYDENNLHGLLLCARSGYEETVARLDIFLPHVDNWATCDLLSPKAFRAHPPQLPEQIRRWLDSGDTYTVRFGLEMLLSFYLDECFRPEYLDWAAEVKSEEYYVRMMVAWYFATALAKQYDAALPYLTGRRLEQWTHNKTIQKAVESYRITPEQKDALRALRWKNS